MTRRYLDVSVLGESLEWIGHEAVEAARSMMDNDPKWDYDGKECLICEEIDRLVKELEETKEMMLNGAFDRMV